MDTQIFVDRQVKVLDTVKDSATDAFLSELAKPSLDQVEPRGARRGEVETKARMGIEPRSDRGMRVRAVVVENQMKVEPTRRLAIEPAQEFQKLLVTMPRQTLPDHLALEDVQRSKKSRRSVALVVVSHRAAATAFHRKARLGTVQRLDLALLVYAKHHGLSRWVEVQADHVGELLDEPRIARQLEAAHPMRLESVGVPDPLKRRCAHTLGLGQGSAAPVRGAFRSAVQRR